MPADGDAGAARPRNGSTRLPRRLRQTLVCLLEGDSEKQLAARLQLSLPTAHQYVTALYRRFGVHSRAQLLSHVLLRVARGSWATVLKALDQDADDASRLAHDAWTTPHDAQSRFISRESSMNSAASATKNASA